MRKTKIVCTLGPATDREGVLREMMRAGMNVARFNFSHGTHPEQLEKLNMVKKVREELDLPIASGPTGGPEGPAGGAEPPGGGHAGHQGP